jgi:hypothetical protein
MKFGFAGLFLWAADACPFFTRILPLFAVSLATPLARNHQRMPLRSGLNTQHPFQKYKPDVLVLDFHKG